MMDECQKAMPLTQQDACVWLCIYFCPFHSNKSYDLAITQLRIGGYNGCLPNIYTTT